MWDLEWRTGGTSERILRYLPSWEMSVHGTFWLGRHLPKRRCLEQTFCRPFAHRHCRFGTWRTQLEENPGEQSKQSKSTDTYHCVDTLTIATKPVKKKLRGPLKNLPSLTQIEKKHASGMSHGKENWKMAFGCVVGWQILSKERQQHMEKANRFNCNWLSKSLHFFRNLCYAKDCKELS